MKKSVRILSLIMSVCLVFGVASFGAVNSFAVDNTLGDANSDGSVNSFDALMVVRYCTDEKSLTAEQKKAADVDGDGKITSLDALYILHFSVGKLDRFPMSGESSRVEIAGGFYYDPATGKVTNDSGSGLLGFSYDASEGVFYASLNAWQRTFGYTEIYDYAAPFIICNFDTSRIYFDYDGKEWMVQLWKGQYGYIFIGSEIGLYYRDFDDNELVDNAGRKFYKCADDDMLVQMSSSLYINDTLLFKRKQQYSWWLTGFTPGALDGFGTSPEATASLTLDATIYFEDEEMMYAFVEGLKNTTEVQHNVSKKVRNINFEYGKNYTVNPVTNSVSFKWQ